ncbi:hypothetical protein LCGC14_1341660 [marine sediment metagenome]|uniref:Uncharacterized protein n=1 Tax=marine sediment metagenome TaxID=412755 RepID=A0A0F9KZZ8_9ZZZZ
MNTHWGVEWHSKNRLDGVQRYFMWENGEPLLFPTRQVARSYIAREYGYIRYRADLRREPHGWRMPQAVRVIVELSPYRNGGRE